jgi:hypothetical protein
MFGAKPFIEYDNVCYNILLLIKEELEKFGCKVVFITETYGYVYHISGTIYWEILNKGTLSIHIVENKNHFTRLLLLGGARQIIEEAIEKHEKFSRTDRSLLEQLPTSI